MGGDEFLELKPGFFHVERDAPAEAAAFFILLARWVRGSIGIGIKSVDAWIAWRVDSAAWSADAFLNPIGHLELTIVQIEFSFLRCCIIKLQASLRLVEISPLPAEKPEAFFRRSVNASFHKGDNRLHFFWQGLCLSCLQFGLLLFQGWKEEEEGDGQEQHNQAEDDEHGHL